LISQARLTVDLGALLSDRRLLCMVWHLIWREGVVSWPRSCSADRWFLVAPSSSLVLIASMLRIAVKRKNDLRLWTFSQPRNPRAKARLLAIFFVGLKAHAFTW